MIKHLAFVMDGNRRYAKKNFLNIKQGYKKGMEKFLEIVSLQIKYNIYETSFFALSKDNYEKRPEDEKNILFNLIDFFSTNKNIKEFFLKNKISLELKGNINKLSKKEKFVRKILKEFDKFKINENEIKFKVNLAINYDGQEEILNSFKNILKQIENGLIKTNSITTKTIKKNLYFNKEEPQIIVRCGNVPRLSGFMLWDSKYSEIYLNRKLWPEFIEEDFIEILNWYRNLYRNFGK